MRKITTVASALALVLPSVVLAEEAPDDRIIVSSSRADEGIAIEDYTGSVSVLSAETLEQRQVRDLTDVLRDVPGVAVAGSPGLSQLRLRGSEANHVLLLVDGIEAASPFYGEADAGTLQAEIASSVEILRGAQSALYGSDAVGGVIAYRTASGCEAPGVAAYLEGGTRSTFNAAGRAALCGDGGELALHVTLVTTDGEPNARGGVRDIGRDGLTLSAKGSTELVPGLELRAVGRYVSTEGDFNNQDFDPTSASFGLVIDSPGVTYENESIYALVGARAAVLDGRWTHDISGQIADVSRDTFAGNARDSGNKGQRLKASYVSSLGFGGPAFAHRLTFAADWEREEFRNTDPFGFAFTGERNARNIGLVGEYQATSDRFDFSAAIRRDLNNRFADATTFRISGGVEVVPGTRLRAAGGSGIKNPGFYELYGFVDGRFIGNPDLKPEKSTGWEVGIDQAFGGDTARLSATYFESELEDEIFTSFPAPTFVATPSNRDTVSKRKGLELAAQARLGPQVTLDAAYTWLDAEENGVEEVRRPGNIASASLNWTAPGDVASATLIVRHNGETDDVAFTDPSFIPVTERLDDFTLVNFAAEAKLSGNLRVFGRVENLFDETYEQVFSFVSPGRTATVGIRAQF
ncbi:TonB-dependent receptor [Altererythrobacter arenosus]|uniref:TonB-dependent receptor n=1 Tax=Altererythrobacter arenosus TaxID=3032592 RepID=A0ABY8FSJ4_9SPHN|nr:TonB-dependent receptor [Altererythrobacter sp. CAU 1644]WFL77978.1 TonB-dependent receptor [Altererythrobacter sp. CAU 1644]